MKTDHQSLKHLWAQKITSMVQQRWWYKLMGFDFKVKYKSGRENVATDILSRKYEEDPKELYAISQVVPNWLDIVKEEIQSNTDLRALVQHAQTGEAIEP